MPTEQEFVNYKEFVESLDEVTDFASTDKSVVSNSTEGPRSVPQGVVDMKAMKSLRIISNDEYLLSVIDSEEKFLFGVKADGTFDWQKGLPNDVVDAINAVYSAMNGKVDKVPGESLIDSNVADSQSSGDNPEYIYLFTDYEGRLLYSVDADGVHQFFTKIRVLGGIEFDEKSLSELENALKANGFSSGQGDWSDKKNLSIPKPKIAVVNFSNISSMPTTKTDDMHGIVEFWDMDGNYFKKKAIVNAQGSSSLAFAKKNIAIDLVNDDWAGDDSFKLKIGKWVEQDSFHLKAFATDFFRSCAVVGYDLYEEIEETRGVAKDATWKLAKINFEEVADGKGLGYNSVGALNDRLDFGARCHPLGFPCIVYLNGEFYGIYQWMMKKHRDNYHMSKSNAKEVHLDGALSPVTIFGGSIDWTQFEVRNPKSLITMDGSNYDGDDPTELIDSSSASYNPSNSKHVMTAQVKSEIEAFSDFVSNLSASATSLGVNSQEFKDLFESVFDVDNIIDYVVFGELTANYDGFSKNWQLTTWDGVRWYINVYDLDGIFGNWFTGRQLITHEYAHEVIISNVIAKYVYSVDDYKIRLKNRYAELKSLRIVTAENVCRKLNDLVQTIGKDFFSKEYEKWPSLCNSSSVVDSHWEMVMDDQGKPVFGQSSTYLDNTSYNVGDECYYGANSLMGFYKFVCVEGSTGNPPFASLAYADTIWRFCKWLENQVTYIETFLT